MCLRGSTGSVHFIVGITAPSAQKIAWCAMASLGKTGTMRNWFDHKGSGFFVPDENGTDGYPLPDIFVHRHALIGVQSLVPGSAVRYRQGWNARNNCPPI